MIVGKVLFWNHQVGVLRDSRDNVFVFEKSNIASNFVNDISVGKYVKFKPDLLNGMLIASCVKEYINFYLEYPNSPTKLAKVTTLVVKRKDLEEILEAA